MVGGAIRLGSAVVRAECRIGSGSVRLVRPGQRWAGGWPTPRGASNMEEESRTSKRARSTASSAASAAPDAPSRTIRVAVEGNIAAGKSTFLNMLTAEFGDVSIVQEPVSKWQNVASDVSRPLTVV